MLVSCSACGRGPAEWREVTAIINVGDDVTLHGLRICPDLDSVMYTLGGGSDPERGWGRAKETWTVKEELAAYGAEPTWFGLGDRDVATHLVRTRMLDAGYPLSAVTAALCARWQPGVTMLPASRRPAGDPRRGAQASERPGTREAAQACISRSGGSVTGASCRRSGSYSSAPIRPSPPPGCWTPSPPRMWCFSRQATLW